MGYFVQGKAPVSDVGIAYEANWAGWSPVVKFTRLVAPDIADECDWSFNDGQGLDADDSQAIAEVFTRLIDSGELQALCDMHREECEKMPDVKCQFCGGTGIRVMVEPKYEVPFTRPGWLEEQNEEFRTRVCSDEDRHGRPHPRAGQPGWCNSCDGVGYKRPRRAEDAWVDVEWLSKWRDFLRDCGGFEIH